MNERGYAMVITLVGLVLMTIVLISAFQTSSVNILVSQNYLDQPTALTSALACEQHMVRRILFNNYSPYTLNNPGNMVVQCATNAPIIVEKNTIIAGASANLKTIQLRFQTTAQGRRNANFNTYTDVRLISNAYAN